MVYETGRDVYAKAAESEHVLPLKGIIRVVRRRLWVIALVVIVLTGITVGFTLMQTPTYEASTKILVGQKRETGDPTNLGSDVEGLQQLTRTLAEAVSSRPLAEAVI